MVSLQYLHTVVLRCESKNPRCVTLLILHPHTDGSAIARFTWSVSSWTLRKSVTQKPVPQICIDGAPHAAIDSAPQVGLP